MGQNQLSKNLTLGPDAISIVAENCRRFLFTLEKILEHHTRIPGAIEVPDLLSGALTLTSEKVLILGNTKINLSPRPLTYELVKHMLQKPNLRSHKNELLKQIFDCNLDGDHSQRYIIGRTQNLSKLISRARHFLTTAFAEELPERARWLVYDHTEDTWALLRVM